MANDQLFRITLRPCAYITFLL